MPKKKILSILNAATQLLDLEAPIEEKAFTWSLLFHSDFRVFFTYSSKEKQLNVYVPLLDYFPPDPTHKAHLYQVLLNTCLRSHKTSVGSFGFDEKRALILFYKKLSHEEIDEAYLLVFLPVFVKTAIEWKKKIWESLHSPKPQIVNTPVPGNIISLRQDKK